MKRCLVIALFVAAARTLEAAAPGPAAAPAVQATLDTNTIHIGESVTLHVEVTHPAGTTVQFPDLTRDRRIVVRDQQVKTDPQTPTRTTADFHLTSFLPGSHLVATNGLLLAGAGSVVTTALPELTLRVESVLTDTNAPLADIKPLARWSIDWPVHLLWILPAVLALSALAAWLLHRHFSRRRGPPALPPREPAHERALRELSELQASGLIEKGDSEPFFVALSAIVRTYIEDRFGLRAPEQTTEEFIRTATTSAQLTVEQRTLTASFLEQCDLVKFARHRPGAAEMNAAHAAAVRFVLESVPPPAPGPGGAA